jgi:DNA-binding transcriptional ArsR family regulator
VTVSPGRPARAGATQVAQPLALVDVLAALSDPVRLEIVRVLATADGERCCAEIPLPVTKSTSSHHYKVLREAGVIDVREEGTRRYQRLRRPELDAAFPGLLDSVLRAAGPVTRTA